MRCKSWKPTDDDHTTYQQTCYQNVMNAKNKGNFTIRNLYDFLNFSSVVGNIPIDDDLRYKVLRTLPSPMRHRFDHLEFFAGQMADFKILRFLSAGWPAANTRNLQSKCSKSFIRSVNFKNTIISQERLPIIDVCKVKLLMSEWPLPVPGGAMATKLLLWSATSTLVLIFCPTLGSVAPCCAACNCDGVLLRWQHLFVRLGLLSRVGRLNGFGAHPRATRP